MLTSRDTNTEGKMDKGNSKEIGGRRSYNNKNKNENNNKFLKTTAMLSSKISPIEFSDK